MSLQDNIMQMYESLTDSVKAEVVEALALEYNRKESGLRQAWFWSSAGVPEQHQPRVIEVLQNACLRESQKLKELAQ